MKDDPQIINLHKVKVVGYCPHCGQPLLDCNHVWIANQDELLCPSYGVRKLAFCSEGCLNKQMEYVLRKMKEARTKNFNP